MEIKETYLNLSNSQMRELHTFMAKMIGSELTGISSPCYMPKFIKYKNDFMNKSNLKSKDSKEFKKQLDKTYSKFVIFNDEFTIFLIMTSIYYARMGDIESSKFAYLLLSIKFYSSLLHISFPKFCSDQLWNLSLSSISPKHLFREKNGVSNALIYLVNEVYRKFGNKITSTHLTDFELVRFVFEIRGRLAQSIRSFAEVYYSLQKSGSKKLVGEETIDANEGLNVIADKLSMSMCTFEQIDSPSLEMAISKSGIRREIAESLIEELSTVDYRNQIRFIIILIGKISPIKYICKDTGRLALIRKIENGVPVGQYVAREEMLKMFFETELGFRLKSMNKSQLVIFFSHYLTKYIQNRVC